MNLGIFLLGILFIAMIVLYLITGIALSLFAAGLAAGLCFALLFDEIIDNK
jgi:hypothetical protein